MAKIILKDCPFCGEGYVGFDLPRRNDVSGELLYSVKCPTCGARTGEFDRRKTAATKWNRRYNEENNNDT